MSSALVFAELSGTDEDVPFTIVLPISSTKLDSLSGGVKVPSKEPALTNLAYRPDRFEVMEGGMIGTCCREA